MDLLGQVNLLLLDRQDFISDDVVCVSGRRHDQLRSVIKVFPGKMCRAGVLGGMRGHAEVLECTDSETRLRFIAQDEPPPPLPVTLLVALPRPQTYTKVLNCAVEMGVKRIDFINSFKVEKSFWQGSRLKPEYIENELRLALEQCADTIMPEIHFHPRFKPFIEDELPEISPGAARIAGIPGAHSVPEDFAGKPTVLAVGPEGGFTDYENEFLQANGFTGVGLGPHILRTEFAVAALLARLSVRI